jgi:3-oxoadipate enol-lactonase
MPTLAIEKHGAGDPVVFIHGLGGTSNVFTPQVNTLSRFFTCVRLDLPGAGRSSLDGAVSIDNLVAAVMTIVNDLPQPAHLIAHSMGTIVAQHLALAAPDKVSSLSLIGAIHAPADAAREVLRKRAATARTDGMTPIADAIVQAGTSAETRAHRPEAATLVREILMRQDQEGYACHCEALAAARPADVTRIKQSALLITGDEDTTAPVPACRILASKFPKARLEILGRCGHWATVERPAEVTEALLAFLMSDC